MSSYFVGNFALADNHAERKAEAWHSSTRLGTGVFHLPRLRNEAGRVGVRPLYFNPLPGWDIVFNYPLRFAAYRRQIGCDCDLRAGRGHNEPH